MNQRILIADDEDTLRSVISEVLTDDGHEVTAVANGEEALRLFREDPFPIVLTDIIMGHMNGLELLNEIKVLRPDTLVVMMTSHASLEVATKALRSGAYDFLIKPFDDLSAISQVVKKACEQARQLEDNNRVVADLRQFNERLQEKANRDGLTGLHNHRFFMEALEGELNRAKRYNRPFSVIFMDVDHFKKYNDSHGHLNGDRLLKELAEILKRRSRATTVLARYGGEEFVVLSPETDKTGALRLADALRQMVEKHPFPGKESQPLNCISLSLGCATYPEDGSTSTEVLDHADKALYRAKHAGRNRVCS